VTDEPRNIRGLLLAEADRLVNGDRNASYGDPNQDFARTADFWNTYMAGVAERKLAHATDEQRADALALIYQLLDPHDVAWMMVLLKASRSTVSPTKFDHYVDAAGYAACGADCATEDER
jgi:hypothetical protein